MDYKYLRKLHHSADHVETNERGIVWDGDGTKCVRAAILTITVLTPAFTLENIYGNWKHGTKSTSQVFFHRYFHLHIIQYQRTMINLEKKDEKGKYFDSNNDNS